MFKLYESFRLCKPLPDESVPLGTFGVVLMVYDDLHYEVEFPDERGGNLGAALTYTLSAESMEPVSAEGGATSVLGS